jgi:serine/threonine protein kinase
MNPCPHCQHLNLSSATRCPSCGSSLTTDVLPVGKRLYGDKVEIKKLLGRGGFGIVYLAENLERNQTVALKEMFTDELVLRLPDGTVQVKKGFEADWERLLKRTEREVFLLKRLKHKSSTTLFAAWQENGTGYLAIELIAGETLEERIQSQRYLDSSQVNQVMMQVLSVLTELHSMGFLHRDIKPSNIMLTQNGVELIDYGSFTPFRTGKRIKVTSRMLTPEYAPLEQYGQEVMLSPSTDLYALAATICEAMTGLRIPSALQRANGASIEPVLQAVRQVSSPLANVLEKALETKVAARYLDAAAMQLQVIRNRTSITDLNLTTKLVTNLVLSLLSNIVVFGFHSQLKSVNEIKFDFYFVGFSLNCLFLLFLTPTKIFDLTNHVQRMLLLSITFSSLFVWILHD